MPKLEARACLNDTHFVAQVSSDCCDGIMDDAWFRAGEIRMKRSEVRAAAVLAVLSAGQFCIAGPPPKSSARGGGDRKPPTPRHKAPWKNSLDMWFVHIDPAGQNPDGFWMGSAKDEEGRGDDEHRHTVKLTSGYWMGRTEVTQGQWKAVMGDNPSHFSGDDNRPVGRVSWDDCQEFCRKLSERCRGTYRLPTEAEWEYACRAGSTGPYAGTGRLDDMAWHSGNSGSKPQPVALLIRNDWGLHDMHGNVSEWCYDRYLEDYHKAPSAGIDPTGPETGSNRVLRGGSYYFSRGRSADRGSAPPETKADNIGLRVVVEDVFTAPGSDGQTRRREE